MQKIVDGVRISYDDAGRGNVLVLLHGFPLDRSIWDAQFEQLAHECRVIRVDLRGSGESGGGDGPALMETMAGDLYGLLDALDVGRVILAGHSMGGYVALAFFRMYAERVAGLALVASHPDADTPARRVLRDTQAEDIVANGMAGAARTLASGAPAERFAATHAALVDRIETIAARQDPAGAVAQIIGMKERVDSGDLLEDIEVPALIVAGESDRLIATPVLERTAAALVDCELVVLPGVGHLPMLEAPAETTAALARLVARCAATDAAGSQSVRATRA